MGATHTAARLTEVGSVCCAAVALAFNAQLVDQVPMCEYDEKVDVLVTSEGAHGCTERGQQVLQSSL